MRLTLLLILCTICALLTWANPLQSGDGPHLIGARSQDMGAPPAFNVFKSKNNPDTQIRFIKDSGVCETTPGVGQLSGYIDIGTNMSMVRSDLISDFCFAETVIFSGSGSLKLAMTPILHRSRFGMFLLKRHNIKIHGWTACQVKRRTWMLFYDRTFPR